MNARESIIVRLFNTRDTPCIAIGTIRSLQGIDRGTTMMIVTVPRHIQVTGQDQRLLQQHAQVHTSTALETMYSITKRMLHQLHTCANKRSALRLAWAKAAADQHAQQLRHSEAPPGVIRVR